MHDKVTKVSSLIKYSTVSAGKSIGCYAENTFSSHIKFAVSVSVCLAAGQVFKILRV